jgi:colicin import membrane protein
MNIYVSLRVLFKPDGSLAQMPVLVAGSPSPLGPALAESGKRALLLCQPFTMLRPEHYAQWRDITVDFDPRDLAGD